MVAKQLLRPDTRGVAVGSVRNGGPAQQAVPALQSWDVIVGLNGQACADVAGFQAATAEALKDRKAPAPVLVAFERQGQQLLAVVEVGIRPPTEPAPEARRAWFPAASQVLSKSLAKALGLEGKKGVRLTQIYPQSAAEKAGFRVGDVITQLDGAALEASEPQHLELFNRTIRAYKVGAEVEFTVLRDRKPVKIAMRLPEAPKPEQECRTHEDVVLEFKARDLTYLDRVSRRWDLDETGVLVTQVAQGGWAAVGGLAAGDLLQGANGQPVTNVRDLEAQLKDLPTRRPKHLTFFVRRGIQTLYLELQPSWPQP
jgi:S1-C subfamily serine protease